MKIISVQPKDLTKQFVHTFDLYLRKYRNQPKLIMFSGGSALNFLPHSPLDFVDKQTTLTVLDERLDVDQKASNFYQLAQTNFFKLSIKRGCQTISPTTKELQSLSQSAIYFEIQLKDWKKANPKGVIVVTQGIGSDGHTAGIMPYPENPDKFQDLFEKTNKWVVAYDSCEKNKYPLRLTVSPYFLQTIVDRSFIFVSGVEKKETLEKIFLDKKKIHEMPARIIFKMKDAQLFTDIDVYSTR